MIYEKKYIDRLIKLAHHLTSGVLYRDYVPMEVPQGRTKDQPPVFQTPEGIEFAFFPFIVDELPSLFPEDWMFNPEGIPVLICRLDLEPTVACAIYLGISPKEFLHLSVPNAQRKEWGGITLPYHARTCDVGRNIFELVEMHTRMN